MAFAYQRTKPWRRASAAPAYPTPADVGSALRVIQAVGCARWVKWQDAIAQAVRRGDEAAIARVRRARSEDQVHFSHVAAALRLFSR